jgi:excinuclease ABC subunit B
MQRAIDETNRRREKQEHYNVVNNIQPYTVSKAVREIIEAKTAAQQKSYYKVSTTRNPTSLPLDQLMIALAEIEKEMKQSAKALDFERAAELRDELSRLKKLLPNPSKR